MPALPIDADDDECESLDAFTRHLDADHCLALRGTASS
jgi:hypothetical protein